MKKRMHFGNKGFTLIEVMLSIAILAMISIPLLKYFSDSLRYAALTEQKQKATLMAQTTLEFIKGQNQLMTYQAKVNNAGETVMHYDINDNLKTFFGVWASPSPYPAYEDLVAAQAGFDPTDGKGTLVYTYNMISDAYKKGYDVKVTMSADKGASEVSRPMEYGINEDTNIVASEFTEEDDALAYFVSQNTAAYIQKMGGYVVGVTPGPEATGLELYTVAPAVTTAPPDAPVVLTPPPGPTSHPYDDVDLLTEDEIKENMRREIIIDITKEDTLMELGATSFYKVCVTYKYTCPNIENTNPLTPTEYISNPLIDTNVESLEGIYIMFNKLTDDEDVITFNYENHSALGNITVFPDIRLICQDIAVEDEAVAGGGSAPSPYTLTMNMHGFDEWLGYHPTLRTNLRISDSDVIALGDCDCTERTIEYKELTDSRNPVRIVKIIVDVYKSGDLSAGADPLIEMVSSKTE